MMRFVILSPLYETLAPRRFSFRNSDGTGAFNPAQNRSLLTYVVPGTAYQPIAYPNNYARAQAAGHGPWTVMSPSSLPEGPNLLTIDYRT